MATFFYDRGPRDRHAVKLEGFESNAISDELNITSVRRWGRLRLANGQVARSLFSEQRRKTENQRTSRNVKVCLILSTILELT